MKGLIMKHLKMAALAIAISVATVSNAFARDYYSVGINVDNYGYNARPAGYSSDYSIGYTNRPRVIYQPTVIYYDSPSRYYEPRVVYRDNRYCGHDNRGYRGHHHHHHED
jgi:hypothetical protein